MSGEAQKVCLQSGGGGGGGVKKVFKPYFPHLPTPLPINNDHSLSWRVLWMEIIALVEIYIHLLDLTRNSCEKCTFRSSRTNSSRVVLFCRSRVASILSQLTLLICLPAYAYLTFEKQELGNNMEKNSNSNSVI